MNPALGVSLKVASALLFTGMSALIKSIGTELPTGEIVFGRSFFAILPILIYICWRVSHETRADGSRSPLLRGIADALKTTNKLGHFQRGFIGCCAMGLSFYALSLLPLPDAITLGYAAPLVTVLLAPLLLGERVGIYRSSAVVVGFVGVLIVLSPHLLSEIDRGDDASLGAMVALAAACCTALAMIQIRALTKHESTMSITFYFSVSGTVFGLASLPFGWVLPDAMMVAKLVTIGFIGGVAQIFLTESYRHAPTSLIAPFDYTTLIWAMVLGYMLFDDVPQPIMLVGASIIVLSGLFVIYRERQLGLERARQRKAGGVPLA
ncbi:DMT family transporter [Tepidamorphus sp. 3E244]|uniref:DMT family transporter n=1 Tax=Tepidamorphus sp. 3E244 TaxID=3385498 RepID=UPI0038FC7107